jgi:hypothetical protein
MESKSLASLASSYISSRGANDSVYGAYFGSNPTSSVTSKFNAVANENPSSGILSCTDPYSACGGGVIAYTAVSTTTSDIYYCSIFYNQLPPTSLCSGNTVNARNLRGATTLHELTHAVASTTDVNYGCPGNQGLSDSDKLRNADNYNVSAQTPCCLSKARVLIWDRGLFSASLPRSTPTPSAKWVIPTDYLFPNGAPPNESWLRVASLFTMSMGRSFDYDMRQWYSQ